jgi:hypothetical protein
MAGWELSVVLPWDIMAYMVAIFLRREFAGVPLRTSTCKRALATWALSACTSSAIWSCRQLLRTMSAGANGELSLTRHDASLLQSNEIKRHG